MGFLHLVYSIHPKCIYSFTVVEVVVFIQWESSFHPWYVAIFFPYNMRELFCITAGTFVEHDFVVEHCLPIPQL